MSNLISAMGKCRVEIATSSRILATEDYVANLHEQVATFFQCTVFVRKYSLRIVRMI